jgi:outer membrane biogenesis lipoprotein LolB
MKDVIVLLLVFLGVEGCATAPRTAETELNLESFLKKQTQREIELSNIQGKIRVRFQLKNKTLIGEARFLREDGKSRFELSDPMGRVRYWIVSDEKESLAYYEDEKKAYLSADSGRDYHLKSFGLELTTQDVQSLWVGILPKSWREEGKISWGNEQGEFEGKIKVKTDEIRFRVAKDSGLITQVNWAGPNKKIRFVITDFDACCSTESGEKVLGHDVKVFLTTEPDRVELEWEELNVLKEKQNPLKFSKSLPKATKVVRLEK